MVQISFQHSRVEKFVRTNREKHPLECKIRTCEKYTKLPDYIETFSIKKKVYVGLGILV